MEENNHKQSTYKYYQIQSGRELFPMLSENRKIEMSEVLWDCPGLIDNPKVYWANKSAYEKTIELRRKFVEIIERGYVNLYDDINILSNDHWNWEITEHLVELAENQYALFSKFFIVKNKIPAYYRPLSKRTHELYHAIICIPLSLDIVKETTSRSDIIPRKYIELSDFQIENTLLTSRSHNREIICDNQNNPKNIQNQMRCLIDSEQLGIYIAFKELDKKTFKKLSTDDDFGLKLKKKKRNNLMYETIGKSSKSSYWIWNDIAEFSYKYFESCPIHKDDNQFSIPRPNHSLKCYFNQAKDIDHMNSTYLDELIAQADIDALTIGRFQAEMVLDAFYMKTGQIDKELSNFYYHNYNIEAGN